MMAFIIMAIICVALIVLWIIKDFKKCNTIVFPEASWLELKDCSVKTNYYQYIRLSEAIRENGNDWFININYFEPDGKVEENILGPADIKQRYHLAGLAIAKKLEDAFQHRIKTAAQNALKNQKDMREKSLKAFLKVKA